MCFTHEIHLLRSCPLQLETKYLFSPSLPPSYPPSLPPLSCTSDAVCLSLFPATGDLLSPAACVQCTTWWQHSSTPVHETRLPQVTAEGEIRPTSLCHLSNLVERVSRLLAGVVCCMWDTGQLVAIFIYIVFRNRFMYGFMFVYI